MTGKRIAVYGGSFNPLHIGHLAIIRHMIEVAGYDSVYLIVSPKNPLKDSISSDSAADRFKAATDAVSRHFDSKVKVDDIEMGMPAPHYTIRTLTSLQKREPANSFTLVIGADNLADIRRWRDYPSILRDFGVAVFPRRGFDLGTVREDLMKEDDSYRIDILDAEMVDISSTMIRNSIASGKDVSSWVM